LKKYCSLDFIFISFSPNKKDVTRRNP